MTGPVRTMASRVTRLPRMIALDTALRPERGRSGTCAGAFRFSVRIAGLQP